MAETWLLNETVNTSSITNFVFDFVSNNTNFKGIIAYDADPNYTLSYLVTTDFSQPQTEVYDENGVWENQAFRTIILAEPATGDLLTWLQANGTKQVARKSYDLSTSAKWATLSSGNHNVQIVAKASGYRDSEKSAAVTVNKPAETFTLSKGTYKFIDNPILSTLGNIPLIFSSNGVSYNGGLNINGSAALARGITYIISFDDSIKVYNGSTWTNQVYREITLSTSQQVPPAFYNWAITDGNLVKQESHTIAVSYNRGAAGYFNLNGTDLASSEKSLSLTEDATIKLYVTSGDLSAAAFNVIVDGVSVTVPDNKTIDVYKQDVQISVSYDDEHSPAELALTLNYHASEQPSASETWVLNETITSALVRQTVNFVSSGSMFVGIKSRAVTSGYELTYFVQQGSSTVELPAYDTTNGWLDTTYRTITFATAPSGDLLTWLQANGTKQRASTGYSVTYNGTLSNGEGSGKYFKVQCDDNEAVTIFDDWAYSETNPVLATNVNKIKFIYGKHAEYPEASNYNWILSSVKLGMQLNYINTSDDDGLEEKETVSEWYTLTENIDDLVFSKKSLITFTIVTAVNGSVVTYNDCVGEAGMLFSDWLTSSYNTHNVTYPVTTADCGSTGYEPATLPSGRTIPVADGVPLWLIQ